MTVPRRVSNPDVLDAVLVTAAAKRSKQAKRTVTVQQLMLEAVAEKYGVEIEIRGRGQRGPGRKE